MKTVGHRITKYFPALFGVLLVVSLIALPSVESRRLAKRSVAESSVPTSARSNGPARILNHLNWLPSLAPMVAGENVELFAADCVTAQTAFTLGQTVCAKTTGVSLTPPGNYYMNWIDSNLVQTNGGTITTDPQYFLFVPPHTGSWKATIGRVSPADSSIVGNPPIFTVSDGPAVSTYAYDTNTNSCTNIPKTAFTLGQTVCATATGTQPQFNRRFGWTGPGGIVRQFTPITTDPQTSSYQLPSTDTSVINGETVDNRGTWQIRVVTSRGSALVAASFTVAAQTPAVNLSIAKGLSSGDLKSGEDATFSVAVYNRGPNDAANVKVTDATPTNATFVSATPTAGSGFSCTGTATVVCTGSVLKPGERVVIDFVYTPGTAGQTITNTATVESDTQELDSDDNSATAGPFTISAGNGGGGTCSLDCPEDIITQANTTDNSNNPGVNVHFDQPTPSGTCGTIAADHCNDCFFPVGTTAVTFTASTGDSCSFNVTVTSPSNAPTISCPANKEVDAHGDCQAQVDVGTATFSGGQNVTLFAVRSDGKPMYNCDQNGNCVRVNPDYPFGGGVTTITWTATSHDSTGAETGSASCTQTITVNNVSDDTTPPVITCPANITKSTDPGQCSAVVNVGTATATDHCDSNPEVTGTRSDNQPLDAPYPKGTTTITWTATDAAGNSSSCNQTVTVNDTEAPAITCPSNITTGNDPGVCYATVNPGTATATDNCDTTPTINGTRSDNQPLNAPYPKGTTTITWTATDSSGNSSSCDQTVTVNDTEAPVINFNGQTPSMWPPNHTYHTFTPANFISSVSDNCDSLSVSDVYITKVTSDEAEDSLTLGDGTTLNDIVIAADCKSVQVRAERVNNGNGRVYTIYFKLVDSSGNATTGTAKIYSPKNQGETPVTDATQYTVTSSCP